jgi:ubiquinone biosynthesis UbiH/UbiF/VisC/COQ6 family hydroxylase
VQFDLIVVGTGPAGCSLACALPEMRIALVGRQAPAAVVSPDLDPRVYTLSPGNVAFLSGLGAWAAIPQERRTPVHAMEVFGDDGTSQIQFDAYRAGVPELAWTVEDSVLQAALAQSALHAANVELVVPAECQSLALDEGSARIGLADGRELCAQAIIGADGAQSFVRDAAGIAVKASDYGQAAVVADFACEKPHRNTAFQWFQRAGVLALLPMQRDHVSMVWSLPQKAAERIGALDADALGHEVSAASRHKLGALALVSGPRAYPLQRLSADRLVCVRVALIGDAGHVIHPLAGQGLNLGFQDARELAAVFAAREPGRDLGDRRLLRRYERNRAEPILAMDLMVDGLFRLFGAAGPAAFRLRNAGLNLTNRLPVLKNLLMRQAMR